MSHFDLHRMMHDFIGRHSIAGAMAIFDISRDVAAKWSSRGTAQIPLWAVQRMLNVMYPDECENVLAQRMNGKKVMLCVSHAEHLSLATLTCLLQIQRRWGDALEVVIVPGGYEDENRVVDRLLKSDVEWSVWVRNNMVFPWGDAAALNAMFGAQLHADYARDFIERLLSHDSPVMSALHFEPRPDGRAMFAEAWDAAHRDHKTHEAHMNRRAHYDVPAMYHYDATFFHAGCFAAHREVFEQMVKDIPETARHNRWGSTNCFTPTAALPADIVFSCRVKALKIRPYVDFGCIVGHSVGNGIHTFWHHNTRAAVERAETHPKILPLTEAAEGETAEAEPTSP